jgi:hypothetical protein
MRPADHAEEEAAEDYCPGCDRDWCVCPEPDNIINLSEAVMAQLTTKKREGEIEP